MLIICIFFTLPYCTPNFWLKPGIVSINIKYVLSFEIKFARVQIFPAEILIYVKWNAMKRTGSK